MKFDVIIGNPPYQENDNRGDRKQLSHNLYSKISILSFNLIKDKGIISFIVPISWMSSSSEKGSKKIKDKFKLLFKKYNVLYLNINNMKGFDKIGSLFSYFVIKKENFNFNKTNVNCNYKNNIYKSNIIMGNREWFPILLSNTTISILDKTCWANNEKFDIQNSNFYHPIVVNGRKDRKLSNTKSDECVYKLYHTNAKFKYGNIPHENQFRKKILFSKSGYIKPFYDKGLYGTTDAAFWIYVASKKEALNIINILTSKLYTFILTVSKWSGFNMPEVVYSLPYLNSNKFWTNSDIYKYFNLTQEEINYIEDNT